MKVSVGVSNRNVHLSSDDFDKLFGSSEFYSIKDLSQEGEFMSNLVVSLVTDKATIDNVRVVGPIREKTQVEISKTDAYKLGLNPPVRMSGDFSEAEDIMLSSLNNKILCKNSCILANRHIHCKTSELSKYNLVDGQVLQVKVDTPRGGILSNVIVKSKPTYNFELHLDTDEANAFGLKNGDVVEIMEDFNGKERY